jgi:hypothetical protein
MASNDEAAHAANETSLNISCLLSRSSRRSTAMPTSQVTSRVAAVRGSILMGASLGPSRDSPVPQTVASVVIMVPSVRAGVGEIASDSGSAIGRTVSKERRGRFGLAPVRDRDLFHARAGSLDLRKGVRPLKARRIMSEAAPSGNRLVFKLGSLLQRIARKALESAGERIRITVQLVPCLEHRRGQPA